MRILLSLIILGLAILVASAAPIVEYTGVCPQCSATLSELRFQIIHTNLTKTGIWQCTDVSPTWMQAVSNSTAVLRQKLLCTNDHGFVVLTFGATSKIINSEKRNGGPKLNCDTNWPGIKEIR
jgi:hypothetical protein